MLVSEVGNTGMKTVCDIGKMTAWCVGILSSLIETCWKLYMDVVFFQVILYQTVFTLVCFMHQTAGTAWSHSLVADLYDIDMQDLVPCYNKFTYKDDEYVENQAMCHCIYSNKHTSFFPIFFSRLAIRTYFLDAPCLKESLSSFHKKLKCQRAQLPCPYQVPLSDVIIFCLVIAQT